ncbi:hypothetical protein H6P81_018085 [Aristolochia fimbriata]|uniref:Uncharacterized protein n=1 Tax=Aristolochia fimbriata TaxID=158543 RepID=A0AAV7E367_ARIFI|nr:hypothetical protein H6P81_018085 [Aristolochia fimbriata]
MGFDYTIAYWKGSDNSGANALSHQLSANLHIVILAIVSHLMDQIRAAMDSDADAYKHLHRVQQLAREDSRYIVVKALLIFKSRLFIPDARDLRQDIIRENPTQQQSLKLEFKRRSYEDFRERRNMASRRRH